jgi:hypothetical protein
MNKLLTYLYTKFIATRQGKRIVITPTNHDVFVNRVTSLLWTIDPYGTMCCETGVLIVDGYSPTVAWLHTTNHSLREHGRGVSEGAIIVPVLEQLTARYKFNPQGLVFVDLDEDEDDKSVTEDSTK